MPAAKGSRLRREMDLQISHVEMISRLVLALGLGAVAGWEREGHHKPAGLRTHMLVCLGAACFTLATLELRSTLRLPGSASSRR